MTAGTVRDALNAHLRPHPVAMLAAEQAATISMRGFPPRAGIISIASSIAAPDLALEAGASGGWRVRSMLRRCTNAAQRLLGKHDFTTFRSTECQAKSPVKTLDQLDVGARGRGDPLHVSARSFLHNQVRSMVGSLVQVGEGKWSADDLPPCSPRATAPPAARWRRRTGYIW